MRPRRGIPRSVATGLGLLACALLAEGLLTRSEFGFEVGRARIHALAEVGEVEQAAAQAARLADHSGAAADDLLTAGLHLRLGRVDAAAARIQRASTTPDSELLAQAAHLRSALHLQRAGVGSTPIPPPSTPALPGFDRDAELAAAEEAARSAVRRGGGSGAAWNAWLALRERITGRAAPDSESSAAASSPFSAGSTDLLRRSLATAESRALAEALPEILRALEGATRRTPSRGPPW